MSLVMGSQLPPQAALANSDVDHIEFGVVGDSVPNISAAASFRIRGPNLAAIFMALFSKGLEGSPGTV